MKTIQLTLEYDGTRYRGWQDSEKNGLSNTISAKITGVLEKMTGETVTLYCGQRTEAGVHAYAQSASFQTASDMQPHEIQTYLNRYLPLDIAVTHAQERPDRFHASLHARSRTFLYRINTSPVLNVFERDYTYHSPIAPDTDLMRQAALLLAGKHDFRAFSTAKKKQAAEKEIYDIQIIETAGAIAITLKADDFLHNMTRLIIGTLLEIGMGRRKKEDIEHIFSGSAKPSTPCSPKGLYLLEVLY